MKHVSFCLKRKDIDLIVRHANNLDELHDADPRMGMLVEGARSFDRQLVSLTYILAKVLENHAKGNKDTRDVLRTIYHLPDELWLVHQELDRGFIAYLMKTRTIPDGEINLEEKLIQMQECYSEYDYDPELRR